MDLEQTVKDLQAQNAQFQEMILNLSKGQEELKALLLEKKKDKKSVSHINRSHHFNHSSIRRIVAMIYCYLPKVH